MVHPVSGSRSRSVARFAASSLPGGAWWLGWVLVGSIFVATAAIAQDSQQTNPAPSPSNGPAQTTPATPGADTGVIKPPSGVDPNIRVKPAVPPAALPMPVIPPPGTPGGNPTVQPK